MLTKERAEILAKYILENEKTTELIQMTPAEAVKVINADGYDFSVDELKEFASQLQTVSAHVGDGELDEESLKGVAGGVIIEWYAVPLGIAIGVAIGREISKWSW